MRPKLAVGPLVGVLGDAPTGGVGDAVAGEARVAGVGEALDAEESGKGVLGRVELGGGIDGGKVPPGGRKRRARPWGLPTAARRRAGRQACCAGGRRRAGRGGREVVVEDDVLAGGGDQGGAVPRDLAAAIGERQTGDGGGGEGGVGQGDAQLLPGAGGREGA